MTLQSAICNLLFAICVFLATGCSYLPLTRSSQRVQSNPTAEALLAQGIAEFSNKRYTRAIEEFQKIKDEFPFTPQAVEVELKLGEAYYLNKQYPEATAAFKDFLALHPTHESVPFVLYHLGLIHLDQFTSVDRDQKVTEIAKGYFESVARQHSKSPYASQAKEKLAKCLEYLAEHELIIASFYMREEKYPAAIGRLEGILRSYRDTPGAVKALYQLGESYRLEKNGVKAALAYEALIQHYPKSDLARDAQVRLSQLEKEKHDPLEMLLARDSRPLPAPPPATSSQQSAVSSQKKELNLVAKKEVVHEEAGNQKGLLRRAADSLNPLAWFSSSDGKREEQNKTIKSAKKETAKGDSPRDPEFVAKVDESLKQRGVAATESSKIKAPAAELPRIDPEPPPRPLDPALLGEIDAKLKSQGKDATQLPAPPAGAVLPTLSTSTASQPPGEQQAKGGTSPSTAGLLGSIDQSLKRKGIEAPKIEPRPEAQAPSRQASGLPAARQAGVKRAETIKLEPKLTVEKGPLFLETGEYQTQEKPSEGKEVETENLDAPQPPKELPKIIVQGPPQPQKEKTPEIKPADKKKAAGEEEEEPKGVLDQIREELKNIGKIFNPFGW